MHANERATWLASNPIVGLDTGNITATTQAWVAAGAGTVVAVRARFRDIMLDPDRLHAAAYWRGGCDNTERDERIRATYESALVYRHRPH